MARRRTLPYPGLAASQQAQVHRGKGLTRYGYAAALVRRQRQSTVVAHTPDGRADQHSEQDRKEPRYPSLFLEKSVDPDRKDHVAESEGNDAESEGDNVYPIACFERNESEGIALQMHPNSARLRCRMEQAHHVQSHSHDSKVALYEVGDLDEAKLALLPDDAVLFWKGIKSIVKEDGSHGRKECATIGEIVMEGDGHDERSAIRSGGDERKAERAKPSCS